MIQGKRAVAQIVVPNSAQMAPPMTNNPLPYHFPSHFLRSPACPSPPPPPPAAPRGTPQRLRLQRGPLAPARQALLSALRTLCRSTIGERRRTRHRPCPVRCAAHVRGHLPRAYRGGARRRQRRVE